MNGNEAYVLSKKFTRETVDGLGSIKGSNCTIKSISYSETGDSVVVFGWVSNSGVEQESQMTVKKGISVKAISINSNNHLIVTLSDNSTIDAGELPKAEVAISEEEGNIIENKEDGLYVASSPVEISKQSGNAIKSKADGIYVEEVSVSKQTNNAVEKKADGLYVEKTNISAEANNALQKKDDGLYVKEVTDVAISKATTNKLEQKSDGLYVPDMTTKVSSAEGNTLTSKEDGLYVGKQSVDISATANNQLEAKPDGLYAKPTDISSKVDKVEGSSLISATDLAQIGTNKANIATLNGTGDGSVSKQIATAIGKLTFLSKEVITPQVLAEYKIDPAKAKFDTIYLVKVIEVDEENEEEKDIYQEWQRLGDETTSEMVMTGNTDTDLSQYVKLTDADNRYLKLTGGTLSGNVVVAQKADVSQPQVSVVNTNTTQTVTMFVSNSQQYCGIHSNGYVKKNSDDNLEFVDSPGYLIGRDTVGGEFVGFGLSTKDVVPQAKSAYDLGSIAKPYANVHTNMLRVIDDSGVGEYAVSAFALTKGTTTTDGEALMRVGNSKASGTESNYKGILRLWNKNSYYTDLIASDSLSASKVITLPTESGTLVTDTVTSASITPITSASGGISSYSQTGFKYIKTGKVCTVVMNLKGTTAVSSGTIEIKIGLLPVGCRPKVTLYSNYVMQDGKPMLLTVSSSTGYIAIYNLSGAAINDSWLVRQTLTFVTA